MCTLYVLVCMFVNAWVHVACMWECASSCVYGAVWACSGVSGLEQAVSGIQGHSLWPRVGDSLRFSEWSSSSFLLRCKVWCQLGRHGPHSLHSHFCRQLWAEAQLASCVSLPTLKCKPPLGPCQEKGAKKVMRELHGVKHGYLCDPTAFGEGLPSGPHFDVYPQFVCASSQCWSKMGPQRPEHSLGVWLFSRIPH